MKKITLILFPILIILNSRAVYGENVQRVFSLGDSISTGLANSAELLSLKEQLLSSRQVVNEAKGTIFPKIDLNFSASTFDNKIPTVLPMTFSSVYLPQGKVDTYYATRLSLWQYLYAGGRYTTNLRYAEIKLSEAQSQYDAMKNTAEREIKKAFYACILAKKKIKIYENALRESKNQDNFRLKDLIAEADHEYKKAVLYFLSTIGLELDTIVDVQGEMEIPGENYNLEKCLAWAYQYRPELRQTQFQETMDSLRVNLSMMERFPTITLGANYDFVGDSFSMEDRSWNATINMNLPIFDGWTSRARVKQRKNQARQGQLRRARIEDQIRLEVRESLMEYNFWKKRVAEVYSRNNRTATIEARIQQSAEKLDVVYKLLLSKADLDWAIGKSLE